MVPVSKLLSLQAARRHTGTHEAGILLVLSQRKGKTAITPELVQHPQTIQHPAEG